MRHLLAVFLVGTVPLGCSTTEADPTDPGGAGGKADEIASGLSHEDAAQLHALLESVGSEVGVRTIIGLDRTFLTAYEVFCLGKNFQNLCFISGQDVEPAFSRTQVGGETADQ